MDEYIKREAALHEINSQFPDAHYPSWFAALIEKIPAVDVKPVKHGRWVYDRLDIEKEPYEYPMEGPVQMYRPWMCSVCGVHKEHRENYCPNCGAKMDLEE